jgi:hypothetical protein
MNVGQGELLSTPGNDGILPYVAKACQSEHFWGKTRLDNALPHCLL